MTHSNKNNLVEIFNKYLLSDDNVRFIINEIYKKILFSKTSIENTCTTLIKKTLTNYNITRYPTNTNELKQAISYINKRCIDDIIEVVASKYPNKNIKRPEENNPVEIPIIDTSEIDATTYALEIITKNQAEDLLKKFGMSIDNIYDNQKNNIFLQFMTDKKLLENLKNMINCINESVVKPETYDKIINGTDLIKLLVHDTYECNTDNNTDIYNAMTVPNEITTETLEKIKNRLEELTELKTVTKNKSTLKSIEDEIDNLISVITEYQSQLDNIEQDEGDYDMNITPSGDIEEMKNITIKMNPDKNIKAIKLLDYFVPKNDYNITRFNNKFNIIQSGRTLKCEIKPGNYEIESLISLINSQITTINVSIVNEKICIKHNNNSNFDLVFTDDTVLKILGFRSDIKPVAGKNTYNAPEEYNLDPNSKVYFSMHGMTGNHIELIFNEKITNEIVLKQSKNGFSLRQLTFVFENSLGQVYDFTELFSLHIVVEFAD
jgi:hypothetical protein